MLFNSISYLIFLPIVFILYWFLFNNNQKQQNRFILVCSYFFYGWWDWRFLSLILLSTIVDYYVGLKIHSSEENRIRKKFLWVSIVFNLSILGFFKYFNFFISSWIDLVRSFGYEGQSLWTLNIILPVGISFYTFQTMSYSLDIYYKKLEPTKDFISFATFVSFFPQLVAGPIERASHLLPQLMEKRKFNYEQSVQGLRLILWGMFKKVAVADSLGYYVEPIFRSIETHSGGELLLGLAYFSIQIYCDFSGYSDIAIGTAKLFGIEVISNFKFPFAAKNPVEFWERWHISLSSWIRDYLYYPLAIHYRRKSSGIINKYKPHIYTMGLMGLWHGANWTFVFWGIYWALLIITYYIILDSRTMISLKNKFHYFSQKTHVNKTLDVISIVTVFFCTSISWILFRSDSLQDAFLYINTIITDLFVSLNFGPKNPMVIVVLFLSVDFLWRKNERDPLNLKNMFIRWGLYISLMYLVVGFFNFDTANKFIYFQF